MKLFDVPRETYVKILDEKVKLPIGNYPDQQKNDVLLFDHIDGMYSYCTDIDDNLIHLAAWTEVEIVTKEEFENKLNLN